MALFRTLLMLFGAAIVVCAVLFLATGRRDYLRWAGRLFTGGVILALLFFGVLIVERHL